MLYRENLLVFRAILDWLNQELREEAVPARQTQINVGKLLAAETMKFVPPIWDLPHESRIPKSVPKN